MEVKEVETMRLDDIEEYIINLFDCRDNKLFSKESGITFRGTEEVKRIGYCTNLMLETIEEAKKNNVNLILTHHDAWDILYGLNEACRKKLLEYNISHYFSHLPLDHCNFGTNASLVKKLKLNMIEKSHKYEGFNCGRIAEFNDGKTLKDLVFQLETLLDESVRFWENRKGKVKKVGIVCGGGSDTLHVKEAVDFGCDVYITGEKNLYTIQYAKFARINLIIGSHTFIELFGIESLANKIKNEFSNIDIIRLKEEHIE